MITVNNLTYHYVKSKHPALKNISFAIQKGEIFGLLGPSGAGKSTIQKILIGLLKNYLGSATLFDTEISEWDLSLYERIGVAFELPNHYLKLSAMENLYYFGSLYQKSPHHLEEVLQWVGLEDASHLKVSQFSKGMKTRLGIARALLHDPELLFLDEPTTGLDPVNARLIKDLIKQCRNKGKTVFLTTHNMELADCLCDRVAFIIDGTIQIIETPRNLKLKYDRHQVCVEYAEKKIVRSKTFQMKDLGNNDTFLQLLKNNDVQTIHSQEATIEDIFIKVTGKSLL